MQLLRLPDLRYPRVMRGREDSCGPRVAWLALRHFGLRTSAARLMRACRWQPEIGAHAVGLAVGLTELGLRVEFQSDPDPSPDSAEVESYARAAALGIPVRTPAPLDELAALTSAERIAILLFDHEGTGHFSILRGIDRRIAVLNDSFFVAESLERMRAAPEVYRQTLVVSRPAAGSPS